MNDFLCTQIVLKITITWWVLFEWLSLDPQQKQRYDWRFSSKCFVSFRSWDTFLLSYWIDFLPGFGRTKNMNKVFRLKRFVNMAFRHCPVVLRLHQIHSKREHFIKFKTLDGWAHNRCCSLKGVWMRSQTIQTILWTWNYRVNTSAWGGLNYIHKLKVVSL